MAGVFRMGFCVSVGLLTFLLCPAIFAQDALQLFHQMQKALGGSEQIAAIRDFEERVHARTWNNEGKPNGEERKRTRWIRPNYLRLDQVGHDNNTYSLYFDGTSGWEILPDKSVLKLVGDELKFAQGYLSGIDFKIWLADRDRYRISSPTERDSDFRQTICKHIRPHARPSVVVAGQTNSCSGLFRARANRDAL
jgi:hypothetical protein